MNTRCHDLQLRLVEEGVQFLAGDRDAQAHCIECSDCFAVIEGLQTLDAVLDEAPAYDVSDQTVDELLERVRSMQVDRPAVVKDSASRSSAVRPWMLRARPRLRAATAGVLAVILALIIHRDSFRRGAPSRNRLMLASEDGGRISRAWRGRVGTNDAANPKQNPEDSSTEQFADLTQSFKSEIDSQKAEQGRLTKKLESSAAELADHKQKIGDVVNTIDDKYENLQREVDSIAAALKMQQEAPTADQAKNLEGPDTIESFGFNSPAGAPPPPPPQPEGSYTTRDFDQGVDESEPITVQKLDELAGKETVAPEKSAADEGKATPDTDTSVAPDNLEPLGESEPGEQHESPAAEAPPAKDQSFGFESGGLEGEKGFRSLSEDDSEKLSEEDANAGSAGNVAPTPAEDHPDAETEGADVQSDLHSQEAEVPAGRKNDDSRDSELSDKERSMVPEPRVRINPQVPAPFVGMAQATAEAKPDQMPSAFPSSPAPVSATGAAAAFFRSLQTLENISFQPPHGYWANTYLPGDPTVRKLQSVLLGRDYSFLKDGSVLPFRLHEASHQTEQPFDAPRDSALGVYVHADRTAISGKTRFLMQIGLKGNEGRIGRRPAMNLGIVLDLRGGISPATRELITKLLFEFNKAREIGDRFSLFAAGREKISVLTPETFSHGQLVVAMKELFDQQSARSGRSSLRSVLVAAKERLLRTEDKDAALGTTSLILIEPRTLAEEVPALEKILHEGAVKGIPASVFAAGDLSSPEMIDRLALAGQGNRRQIRTNEEIAGAVQREIESVSTTVARAVRLNIRLAANVHLVDILGSSPLDKQQAQRVREAETSIDRRIQKNLGITADRGSDEDGIQIVIPAYHSGDAHVILLDLVADGPGPVAEVSARYKDLVQLRNGVLHSTLMLAANAGKNGMLENNVLKNRLALELSHVLSGAAEALGRNDRAEATKLLSSHRAMLLDLGAVAPEILRDREIQTDIALLAEYLRLLREPPAGAEAQTYLQSSLEYAGIMRIQPHPKENPAG